MTDWPEVERVTLSLCADCLDGKGGECHTPGCALWMCAGPAPGLRDMALMESLSAPVDDALLLELALEVERQDAKHGPYQGTRLGRSRLALATLEDEVNEAIEAWRDERHAPEWVLTRVEVLQVAAVAIRTLRDAL